MRVSDSGKRVALPAAAAAPAPTACETCPILRDLDLARTLSPADYQEIRTVLCAGCPSFDSERMVDRWLGGQDSRSSGAEASLFALFRACQPFARMRSGQPSGGS